MTKASTTTTDAATSTPETSPAMATAIPPQGGAEIVYPPPGLGSSGLASSAGAVRGPTAAAGSVDRAHLSEEAARACAADGHRDEAIAIYRLLLAERPGDAEFLRRLSDLEREVSEERDRARAQRPKIGPSGTGPHVEPFGMLDLEELPEHYGVDEVELLFKDPWWSFVYWEVTDGGLAAARAQLGVSGGSAKLVLRLFTTLLNPSGAAREIRDVPLTWNHGRRYIDVPRPGSMLRVAVGLLSGEGLFAPIAHSSMWRLPPPHPVPQTQTAREWMQVAPLRGRGEYRERLTIVGLSTEHSERALQWRVAEAAGPGEAPAAGYHEGPGEDRAAAPGTSPGKWGPGSGSGGVR